MNMGFKINNSFFIGLAYLILAALLYSPIFGYLETWPIRIWDEARLAINAYEMLNNEQYLVTHFNGKPDLWNTKPPLLIWIQVFFMKMIGVKELALRLPSAIAAFFTCVGLMFFSVRFLKNFWFGFITLMVLITSMGYISMHGTRTGDYESLLCLFTTMLSLAFFLFTETKNNIYLYFFFILATLAVLTKGIAGILFFPSFLIYYLSQNKNKIKDILFNKHAYVGLGFFVLIVLGYYWLRENQSGGYIKAVQLNELGGRYLTALEDHQEDFCFIMIIY